MKSSDTYKEFHGNFNKTFVSDKGLATLTCPNCGLAKQVSVASYAGKKQQLKVRCRCKQTFITQLEFRQISRKKTDLSGTYQLLTEKGGGLASIRDISKDGIGLMISGTHKMAVGQKILVRFTLDDRKQTPLQKQATVKSVDRNRIGCEFTKLQAFEPDLGFYLRA